MKHVKPDMTLMDQVHALTFEKKVAGWRPNDKCDDVMRQTRARLKKAQRFVIDDDAITTMAHLNYEEKRHKGWSFLARLPFETIWFEFNVVPKIKGLIEGAKTHGRQAHPYNPDDPLVPKKMGYLMYRDSQDPDSHRWICQVFTSFGEDHVIPVMINVVFDPEGTGRFPVRGSQVWSTSTLSLRKGFPRVPVKTPNGDEFSVDPELIIMGLDVDKDRPTFDDGGPDWLNGRMAVTIDPWWDAMFEARFGGAFPYKTVITEIHEHAGHFRWMMVMLATINGLPRETRWHTPRTAKHSVGMHQLPFFGHGIITLTVPRENRIIHCVRALDSKAKIERHNRRHAVIGHWRIIERGKRREFMCRHSPIMVEHDVGLCERCELLVRWIPDHERGDATLGYVRHTYEVTK